MTAYSFPGMNPDGTTSAARREHLGPWGAVTLLVLRGRSPLHAIAVRDLVEPKLNAVTMREERDW